MRPIDALRQLPLEIEPPRGVRERARERLLASLSTPIGALPMSDIAPRPPWPLQLVRHNGAKPIWVALGSGVLGAAIAIGVPTANRHSESAPRESARLVVTSSEATSSQAHKDVESSNTVQIERVLPTAESHTRSAVTPKKQPQPPRAIASLAAERELLDAARQELSIGQASRAFDLTEAHLRRFAAGRLAEEREVLAINALARLGEKERARARAAQFGRNYPNSFLDQSIEASLRDAP